VTKATTNLWLSPAASVRANVAMPARDRGPEADPSALQAPDLVKRNVSASRPDELWVADFTYCSTWSGIDYVAFIIDVYSRRLVGWKAARSMTQKAGKNCHSHRASAVTRNACGSNRCGGRRWDLRDGLPRRTYRQGRSLRRDVLHVDHSGSSEITRPQVAVNQ
jgi:transposase InsO family protein